MGAPIPVKKIMEPEQADVDELHSKYLQVLADLFESYKTKYGVNENVNMIFD